MITATCALDMFAGVDLLFKYAARGSAVRVSARPGRARAQDDAGNGGYAAADRVSGGGLAAIA